MDISFAGKIALVTSSGGGIGLAAARGFAAAGAETIVNSRSQKKADEVIAILKRDLPKAKLRGIGADVSDAAGCAALIKAVPEVDILVNNTGIFEPKDFFDISDEDWTRFFETNLMSGVRLSRAWMKGMLKRNWGRIIFVSSESALQIPPEMVQYGVTKTAQLGLSRGLAELTAGTGVTVNAVLPGPTLSDGIEDFLRAMAKREGVDFETMARNFVKQHRPSSLLQRFATVDEIASMVLYVASPQASATNGAALRVDGGVVRSIA